MDQFLALTFLDSCVGWLGGLTLIVVGLVAGRQAKDLPAGFIIAGAGALKILLNCCLLAPNLAYQYAAVEIDPAVFETNIVLIHVQRLLFFGLIAAGMTRLSSTPKSEAGA